MANEPTKSERIAWSPKDWGAAIGVSHTTVYQLIADQKVRSVKLGGKRLITTPPVEFIASLTQPQAA
ncbi:MAG TPA: hypothetical protein VMT54_21195 [Candidatus Cybelea sp.]|nr:hypothetical protein [Candidatus Cybelea sp.]